MILVAICVAIPVVLVGLLCAVRYFYGDEAFGIDTHDLNRPDDYRLIKTALPNPPKPPE